jgi:transcriptional regulator with XRE-family HTH domain
VQAPAAENLGTLLRESRRSQKMTQDELAGRAGVARSTLNRWERGTHQPRLPELTAVLDVLNAASELRTRALELISAPRAIQSLRAEQQVSTETESAWLFTPETGDLLRTLRLRRGMTQEQVADRMGIRRVNLSHWETGEQVPSSESLHELMILLGALPAEQAALTRGVLMPSYLMQKQENPLEAALAQYRHITAGGFDPNFEPLKDLEYLRLERRFTDLMPRYPTARQHLLNTYSYHAHWLSNQRRYSEAARYADRVLEAVREARPPEPEWKRVIMISARSAVYSGGRRRARRGTTILEHWLPLVETPEYKAWILGDMALYFAEEGELQCAIEAATRSCRVAIRCHNPFELWNRRTDLAEILLHTELPHDAMRATELLPTLLANHPEGRVREALLWAKALWLLEEKPEAQKWLEHAHKDVLTYNLDPTPVHTLAQRF